MKKLLLIVFMSLMGQTYAQSDFILSIDNIDYEISLDEQNTFKVNGKNVSIMVKEKDTLVFNDGFFSFQHLKANSVSRTILDEGIEQIMIMTASGSGILVQKYDSFNPTMLQEMMLNEVTKESISYGYKLKRMDYEKTLSTGQTLQVLKAELKYKGEIEVYEISAFGKKDEGILIMTMNMNDDLDPTGTEMIKLMWKSLKI